MASPTKKAKAKQAAAKRKEEPHNHTYYTYVSSCQVPPKVPGKQSFVSFNQSLNQSLNQSSSFQAIIQESVEAKTVFAMQRFELVTDPLEIAQSLKRAKTEQAFVSPRFSAQQRVKVTMLSQTSSGNQ